jgi:hypothetical protein
MSLVPNVGVQQGCGKLGVACESPLIPRLQRLFRTPIVSKLMLCHSQNNSLDGLFIPRVTQRLGNTFNKSFLILW